jgi:hypothetical protein
LTASQRGLSGTNSAPRKKTSDGAVTAVNIQRQPNCPFHDWRIASAVAPAGTLSAISQLTICAARIPTTMVSWFMDTRRPRHGAGLTSAMYTGETLEAIPIATPPAMRQTTKNANVGAHPVSTEETAKIAAEAIRRILRPKRSAAAPATSEPSRHPSNAQLLAQPISRAEVS